MKLRRALATAVAAAAIAPATLMAAPAAFAADASASAAPSTSATAAPASAVTAGTSASSTPSDSASPSDPATGAPGSGDPGTLPTAPLICGLDSKGNPILDPKTGKPIYQAALNMSITGLPGQIVRGSGWHNFSLNLSNPSKNDLTGIGLAAGVGPAKGHNLYSVSEVRLQAFDPDQKQWFDVSDDGQTSVGVLGSADLAAGDHFPIKMRLEATSAAPLGKGLTVGFGLYEDTQNQCTASTGAFYKIDIVAKKSSGAGNAPKPTSGGQVPLPTKPPAKGSGNHVIPTSYLTTSTGNLAKTGGSSTTPMIAGVGAAAVLLGAGAVFAVRRRKGSVQA